MLCPYKDNRNLRKLPCQWHSHPKNENIRICDGCKEYYHIDELVYPWKGFLALILFCFLIFMLGYSLSLKNSEINQIEEPFTGGQLYRE